MKTLHNYSIEEETWEEQSSAGRHNPGYVLVYRDKKGHHRAPLSCGGSDDVNVFREDGLTIVTTVNYGLGYCGIETFQGSELKNEMFLQSDYEVEEIVGDLDRLSPITIAKRLLAGICLF